MQKDGFLLITNTIRPFHKHNIAILSLPPGARYHFRYPKAYVSPAVSTSIIRSPGLLVVRNKDTGEMLPLRWCTAITAEDYGEFLFFDFQFDLIFDARSLSEANARMAYQARLEALLPAGTKNVPGADLTPLVFQVPVTKLRELDNPRTHGTDEVATTEHVRRWLAVTSLLGQLDAYQNEHFYTVSRMYHEKADRTKTCEYGKLSNTRNGYKLTGNRLYFLEIVQVTVPFGTREAPIDELRLTSPAGHAQELRASWAIDGPYDRVRFLLYVLPQEVKTMPSILILSKRSAGMSESQDRSGTAEMAGASTSTTAYIPPTLLDANIVWGFRRFFGKRILP